MTVATDPIRNQAEYLALENRAAEPGIEKIYWLPNPKEVRLIELLTSVAGAPDHSLHPFYFRAAPADNLPFPSGVALIRPEEFRKLQLPEGWGSWDDAVEI